MRNIKFDERVKSFSKFVFRRIRVYHGSDKSWETISLTNFSFTV